MAAPEALCAGPVMEPPSPPSGAVAVRAPAGLRTHSPRFGHIGPSAASSRTLERVAKRPVASSRWLGRASPPRRSTDGWAASSARRDVDPSVHRYRRRLTGAPRCCPALGAQPRTSWCRTTPCETWLLVSTGRRSVISVLRPPRRQELCPVAVASHDRRRGLIGRGRSPPPDCLICPSTRTSRTGRLLEDAVHSRPEASWSRATTAGPSCCRPCGGARDPGHLDISVRCPRRRGRPRAPIGQHAVTSTACCPSTCASGQCFSRCTS